jgi:hypothetical protein
VGIFAGLARRRGSVSGKRKRRDPNEEGNETGEWVHEVRTTLGEESRCSSRLHFRPTPQGAADRGCAAIPDLPAAA